MAAGKYPSWLEGHIKSCVQSHFSIVNLFSTAGNELLEVWYYGDLYKEKNLSRPYIVDRNEAPVLVAARDPKSGEEFVIFDGGLHGYDNMFCNEFDSALLKARPLKRYKIPASRLIVKLGYDIDYDDEKSDWSVDEADTVKLVNGNRIPWAQLKTDGIDYIALFYVNLIGKQVQILDMELA